MSYKAYTEYTDEELERAEEQLRDELTDRGWDPDENPPTEEDIHERAELNREPDPDDWHDRRIDRQMDDDYFRANDHLND